MYSDRYDLAIVTVLDAHRLARRKTGQAYQASHVIAVATIVHDFGFDEDVVVAALLHDTLEDTDLSAETIRERFGDAVLAMVQDVTEPAKQVPWRERKRAYVERLRGTPRTGSLAIASADKIHNLATMSRALQAGAQDFWAAFNAPAADILEYQRQVQRMLQDRWTHPILDRHDRELQRFLSAVQA